MITRPRLKPAGFTLIETVTALAISTIILAGLGSILAMSLKAFPPVASDEAARAASLQDAAQWISDDLGEATSILELDADEVEFRVHDRTKDSVPDLIRYWWPGGASGLKRSVNGVETGDLGPGLGSFKLEPRWGTGVGTPTVQSPTLRSEQTLLMVSGTGTTDTALGSSMVVVTMVPALDADTTAWRPTSVRVMITTKGAVVLATLRARLYSGRITDLGAQTALSTSAALNLSLAATDSWTTFNFSSVPDLAPGTILSIVVDSVITLGTVSMRTSTSVPIQDVMLATGSGASWTYAAGGGAPLIMTGRQWRPTSVSEDETRLLGVDVSMTASSGRSMPARFSVTTLAEPTEE
jgi:prepilin-type N-terminal cleavage/methylation domain-containing protein